MSEQRKRSRKKASSLPERGRPMTNRPAGCNPAPLCAASQHARKAIQSGASLTLARPFSRQPGGILVRALAELTAQTAGQRYRRIAELVAHLVGGRQRAFPLLVAILADQVQLLVALGPARRVYSQEPNRRSRFPIAAEQFAHFFEQLGIE